MHLSQSTTVPKCPLTELLGWLLTLTGSISLKIKVLLVSLLLSDCFYY